MSQPLYILRLVDWFFRRLRENLAIANDSDDCVAKPEDEHDDADDPADGRIEAEAAEHLVDGEQRQKQAEPDERLRVEQRFPVRRLRQEGPTFIDQIRTE